MKQIAALIAAALATIPVHAGSYIDTTLNNSFASAVDLSPYFSTAFNPDVGDISGANTSLSAPWVTVGGQGNGGFDYYRFTTAAEGAVILDIDRTWDQANGFDSWLRLYDAGFNLLAQNDDSPTAAGAGGSTEAFNFGISFTRDAFIQASLPAGTYYAEVGQCCTPFPIDGGRAYTLQVQTPSPIPEPASAVMLLAGLALLGGAARRRRG